MNETKDLYLAWERMREGHLTRGVWYPDQPPSMVNENASGYTNRLNGARGAEDPYDHDRGRECSMGYHLTCSSINGGPCECPCHTEPGSEYSFAAVQVPDTAVEVFARLYYLPELTAQRVMVCAENSISFRMVRDLTGLRAVLSSEFGSPIGPWFVADIGSILAKYTPALSGLNPAPSTE